MICQATVGVFRHRPRHGQSALHQFGDGALRYVAAGDRRLLLTNKHPKAHVLAFRAFEVFRVAKAATGAERCAFEQYGIGAVGTAFGSKLKGMAQQGLVIWSCGGHGSLVSALINVLGVTRYRA